MIKEIADSLYHSNMIEKPVEIDFDCVMAKYIAQPYEIARAASVLSRGQWKSFPHGIFGLCGRKNGWILPRMLTGDFEALQKSRADAEMLTGKRCGYSNGGCARKIMDWALPETPVSPLAKQLLVEEQISYHDCAPSLKNDCELIDMRSCYFQIMTRLKSPRMSYSSGGRLISHPLTRNEETRLRDAYKVIENNKILRNCVWGANLGQLKGKAMFVNGQLVNLEPVAGNFQTSSLLIARLGWELCRAASEETSSIYSNVDSIICESGKVPLTWRAFGMTYRTQHAGDADVRLRYTFRIGEHETPLFKKSGFLRVNKPRQNAPARLFTLDYL